MLSESQKTNVLFILALQTSPKCGPLKVWDLSEGAAASKLMFVVSFSLKNITIASFLLQLAAKDDFLLPKNRKSMVGG